ncbi:MAG: DUF3135 domain-containing protein [Gammaproteobacteria bacterium]|nr:DUF3135 domain-containing protein [Gammaproteobacteria bacterium]
MTDNIDFDSWYELASNDPQAFEARRKQVVDAEIDKVPEPRQHRLRCLQWRIEKICSTSPNPMNASVRLSHLMWESLSRQQDLLHRLCYKPYVFSMEDQHVASIIPFPINTA